MICGQNKQLNIMIHQPQASITCQILYIKQASLYFTCGKCKTEAMHGVMEDDIQTTMYRGIFIQTR